MFNKSTTKERKKEIRGKYLFSKIIIVFCQTTDRQVKLDWLINWLKLSRRSYPSTLRSLLAFQSSSLYTYPSPIPLPTPISHVSLSPSSLSIVTYVLTPPTHFRHVAVIVTKNKRDLLTLFTWSMHPRDFMGDYPKRHILVYILSNPV